MICKKQEIIPQLIENKIISIISHNLESENDDLVINILSVLLQIINSHGYEVISQQFKNAGGPRHLQTLLVHQNEEIQQISNRVNSFIVESGVNEVLGNGDFKPDAREINEMEDEGTAETPTNRRNVRKRSATVLAAERPNVRSKRSQNSFEQMNTESFNSVVDDDRELYNDFDDISSPPRSPVHPIVLELPNEMLTAEDENNDERPSTGNESAGAETLVTNLAGVINEIPPVGADPEANR
uniref:Uncharacterized protein n=1 Tax=Panagrolaimus sp. ES5 TaxID=591445 RepID=A0AC34FJI8_9BILA